MNTYKVIVAVPDEKKETEWIIGNGMKITAIWSAPAGYRSVFVRSPTPETDSLLALKYKSIHIILKRGNS